MARERELRGMSSSSFPASPPSSFTCTTHSIQWSLCHTKLNPLRSFSPEIPACSPEIPAASVKQDNNIVQRAIPLCLPSGWALMTDFSADALLCPLISELGCTPTAVILQRRALPSLQYRPLQPCDFAPLKLLHQQLFPIDYDDKFFNRAVHGLDQIASWAALAPFQVLPSLRDFSGAPLAPGPNGGRGGGYSWQAQQALAEQLVGFITAKPFAVQQVETRDRQLLGYADPSWDRDQVLYILTLGVAEEYRNAGIATRLVEWVVRYAAAAGCRAVYLHVISYNTTAMAFYQRLGFKDVALIPDFYVIRTGRQINPHRQLYDAVLFTFPLYSGIPWGLPPCPCSPASSSSPHGRPAASRSAAAVTGAGPGPGPGRGSGSGILETALSQLAACVQSPLTASCSPQPRRRQAPPDSPWWQESGSGSEVGSDESQKDRGWRGQYGRGEGGYSSEGSMLHRRAVPADGASWQAAGVMPGARPLGHPPDWLRGLFARR